ncbi:MAG: hypothetical protein ACI9K5_002232, partial [Gammaproteobacteria bacterium]
MTRKFAQLTFTDSVKAAQTHYGSRSSGEKFESWELDDEHLSDVETQFII